VISHTPAFASTLRRVLRAPVRIAGSSWDLTRSVARILAPGDGRPGSGVHPDPADPVTSGVDASHGVLTPAAFAEPDELTTRELLVASQRPLRDTGDPTRADRARRLAHQYLQRRQERLRAELDHHG
jgi:hypothetical protein